MADSHQRADEVPDDTVKTTPKKKKQKKNSIDGMHFLIAFYSEFLIPECLHSDC